MKFTELINKLKAGLHFTCATQRVQNVVFDNHWCTDDVRELMDRSLDKGKVRDAIDKVFTYHKITHIGDDLIKELGL